MLVGRINLRGQAGVAMFDVKFVKRTGEGWGDAGYATFTHGYFVVSHEGISDVVLGAAELRLHHENVAFGYVEEDGIPYMWSESRRTPRQSWSAVACCAVLVPLLVGALVVKAALDETPGK